MWILFTLPVILKLNTKKAYMSSNQVAMFVIKPVYDWFNLFAAEPFWGHDEPIIPHSGAKIAIHSFNR